GPRAARRDDRARAPARDGPARPGPGPARRRGASDRGRRGLREPAEPAAARVPACDAARLRPSGRAARELREPAAGRLRPRLGGDQESQAGERRAGERGLHVDLTGLAPELRDRERVRDGLLAGVGLARAARCEAHSGPAARLEDAERPEPEREDEREAPAAVYACEHQDGERDAARHEGARAEQQPAPAARGHEVRGAGGHRAHLSTWGTPTWPPNPPNARSAAGNPWRSSMTRAWLICSEGREAGVHRGWPES